MRERGVKAGNGGMNFSVGKSGMHIGEEGHTEDRVKVEGSGRL